MQINISKQNLEIQFPLNVLGCISSRGQHSSSLKKYIGTYQHILGKDPFTFDNICSYLSERLIKHINIKKDTCDTTVYPSKLLTDITTSATT